LFYAAIAGFTLLGIGMNFLGFNPMKALVGSGIVQGFSTPPLLLLIMLMTNRRSIMGNRVNGRWINVLGPSRRLRFRRFDRARNYLDYLICHRAPHRALVRPTVM